MTARRKAARVITAARSRAAVILRNAEREAAVPAASANTAVRRLYELLGGKAEVADLCGITVKAVGDMLTYQTVLD